MLKRLATPLAVLLLLFVGTIPTAYAELARVGPIGFGGYPAWYQDKTGLALDFCSPTNVSERDGGWCLLLTADVPVVPEVFPTSFFDEHFYWAASADAGLPGTKALLTLAHEGAFAVGPVIQGDQIVFGRLRISIAKLPASGTYTIYTPFGKFVFPALAAGDRLFYTSDIGLQCPPGQFDCALATQSGPFLLPSATPGGAEVPPIPDLLAGVDPYNDVIAPKTAYPDTGRRYIADPARLGPVTGGYCVVDGTTCVIDPATGKPAWVTSGGLRNPNIFRVEVSGGTAAETTFFNLMGRVFEGAIAGKVTVDRASYARSATTPNKVDVYATAFPSALGRLPAAPPPAVVPTTLSFFDAPCATDPTTGAVTGPPAGFTAHQMFQAGSNYFAQSNPLAIPANPAQVCLQANATTAGGASTTTYTPAPLGDQVFITEGLYDPLNHALSVKATSSDQVFPPTLTVAGFGDIDPLTGQAVVPSLFAPPAEVTVISTAGGQNRFQVSTGAVAGTGGGGGTAAPVAFNDEVQINEDCSATASVTPCATPVIINVLGNDANAVGGTVALATQPLLGTAGVNADGTISYTPKLNANMVDTFQYTVTVGTQVSNAATITVYIVPVNDAPVANNDTLTALANITASLNVLANDTDPDAGDTRTVRSVSAVSPATATATINATGTAVNFLAPAAGTYTFTYTAQDAALLPSNSATVTVTVAAQEVIAITRALVSTSSPGRFRVDGTLSPSSGKSINLEMLNTAGAVVGTWSVTEAAGLFTLDVKPFAMPAGANRLRATSSSGTSTTVLLTVR